MTSRSVHSVKAGPSAEAAPTKQGVGLHRLWRMGAPLALLACLCLCACNASSQSDAGTSVIYAAVGSACFADITYQDLSGVQTLLPSQPLPWQFPFSVPSSQVNGFPIFLSATNDCATGTLTVNVVVNGTLYASGTTNVANGTATVNTSLF